MRRRRAARATLVVIAPLLALLGGPRAAPPCPVPADEGRRLAVLPLDNRSGEPLPAEELLELFTLELASCGFDLVPADRFEEVLAENRVRYTGGVSDALAATLRDALGATGVLVTTVDLWRPGDPPAIALTSRLVEAGPPPRIRWIDDASLVGDQRPGFLALSAVHDVEELSRRAFERLTHGLALALMGSEPDSGKPDGRFRPRRAWIPRSPAAHAELPLRVAVLPFRNETDRRHAGDLVALQMLRHVAPLPGVAPIDPGQVRAVLLQTRTIAEHGLSIPQVELLRATLGADLVVTGTVFEYDDGQGNVDPAAVNFTSLVFDAATARLAASALSANTGDGGVWLFDWGRSWTAHTLSSRMAARFVHELFAADGGEAAHGDVVRGNGP